MNIDVNKTLLNYNTFHINAFAEAFIQVHSENELLEAIEYASREKKKLQILGCGSNILLTKNIEGFLLHNKLKGIEIVKEDEASLDVKFMSGELWHDCVRWCVDRNYGGIENLSLIPGTVGAAPIQNIGAYGVELQQVFLELEALHFEASEKKIFTNTDCCFGYRNSIFKQEAKNQYFILSVTLRLQKNPVFNISYGNIQQELEKMNVKEVSIQSISDAVIAIRQTKLPDPNVIGNAGSFFKNPVIEKSHFDKLKIEYHDIPFYPSGENVKIPAAWLIEKCGWKGYKEGNFGVHEKQALCLVNYSNASGMDILNLSERIITSVQLSFNILLEREVNIW